VKGQEAGIDGNADAGFSKGRSSIFCCQGAREGDQSRSLPIGISPG